MKGTLIYHVEMKRFLDETEASTYVGMSKTEFRRVCPLKPMLRAQGRKVWDVSKLDAWQDGEAPVRGQLEEAISRL